MGTNLLLVSRNLDKKIVHMVSVLTMALQHNAVQYDALEFNVLQYDGFTV